METIPAPAFVRKSHLRGPRRIRVFGPNAKVVGRVIRENNVAIFVQQIHDDHRYQDLDGLTVGQFVEGQLRRYQVRRLRYLLVDGAYAAVYEVDFEVFLDFAVELPCAHGKQRVLPRVLWRRMPLSVHPRRRSPEARPLTGQLQLPFESGDPGL